MGAHFQYIKACSFYSENALFLQIFFFFYPIPIWLRRALTPTLLVGGVREWGEFWTSFVAWRHWAGLLAASTGTKVWPFDEDSAAKLIVNRTLIGWTSF